MAQRQFRSDDTSKWTHGFGNGSDGSITISADTTYDGANASCSGTADSTTLTLGAASTFANGDLVMIHQTRCTGVGNWELNKIVDGGGGTTLTLQKSLINTYTDSGASQAQIVEMKQYSSVTVNSAQTWSAPEWDGNVGGIIAFFCKDVTTVTGNISTNSRGFRGDTQNQADEYGGADGGGEGTVNAAVNQSQAANGNGGGGGDCEPNGSTVRGGAGGGGHSAGGGNGTGLGGGTGGTGGTTAGVAALITMVFGGGGGGYEKTFAGAHVFDNGGDGGGIVLVISKTITVTGGITTTGQAGTAGADGGSGGGAGGSVLLKRQTITLGTTLVTALAGAGTTNSGAGSAGRIHADYKNSISGTTNPTLDSTQDTTLNKIGTSGLISNYW